MKDKKYSLLLAITTLLCCLHCACGTKRYGHWDIASNDTGAAVPWAAFQWASDSIGGRFIDKYAMLVPAKIKGIPYPLSFQFDLGSNLTRIYGKSIRSLRAEHPSVDFEHPEIHFGSLIATTELCYIDEDQGESLSTANEGIVHIGTIGSDMFQDKVLIIDYPRQLFAVCDKVPPSFVGSFADISLDKYGRILLPAIRKGKRFDVLLDNGSSIFPLLTTPGYIDQLSTSMDTDTMEVSAWGALHLITGRPMKDTFVLAGSRISDITVYADHNVTEENTQYSAITGNVLFRNKTIIIDFRNKKFGIR